MLLLLLKPLHASQAAAAQAMAEMDDFGQPAPISGGGGTGGGVDSEWCWSQGSGFGDSGFGGPGGEDRL